MTVVALFSGLPAATQALVQDPIVITLPADLPAQERKALVDARGALERPVAVDGGAGDAGALPTETEMTVTMAKKYWRDAMLAKCENKTRKELGCLSAASAKLSLLAASAILAWSISGGVLAQERVEPSSPEELLEFFETLNYTPEAWQDGIRDVPRIYLMEVGPSWKVNSQNIEVIHKKHIFFRVLGPLVLRANEKILADRERLLAFADMEQPSGEDAAWLSELAQRYKVGGAVDADAIAELTRRVDAVPPSLVLAQGAEESGWGTSRFAAEGNALFGQWTWGGKGIKPKEQREGLGDYRIAAFDTPLESVEAYLFNINTNDAYEGLRQRRAEMRVRGAVLSGWDLAETLVSYSERGPEYVKSLHAIMRVNKLQPTDEAALVGEQEWEVYPKGN